MLSVAFDAWPCPACSRTISWFQAKETQFLFSDDCYRCLRWKKPYGILWPVPFAFAEEAFTILLLIQVTGRLGGLFLDPTVMNVEVPSTAVGSAVKRLVRKEVAASDNLWAMFSREMTKSLKCL